MPACPPRALVSAPLAAVWTEDRADREADPRHARPPHLLPASEELEPGSLRSEAIHRFLRGTAVNTSQPCEVVR